jgi:hypothetical protein
MNSRRFFLSVIVALTVLVAYNIAILHTSRSSQRQQARAALESVPPGTQALFLGNSLVEAGCDADTFMAAAAQNGVPLRAVNLALGATTPVEHVLILQRALQGPVRPKYIVYGFFDDQLNVPVKGDWSLLVGNRALSYYYPEAAAELYAPGSRLKRWELELTRPVPMLAERSSLWTKVELLRRRFGEVGMPRQATNRYGRVADFTGLQAADVDSFNRRCGAIVAAKAGFSPPVQELFRLARAAGTKVILVEMPLPSGHRATFYASPVWAHMRSHLQALAAEAGATYLVASDWVRDDENFEDAAHLNETGAKVFSARLAGAIARLEARPLATVGSP